MFKQRKRQYVSFAFMSYIKYIWAHLLLKSFSTRLDSKFAVGTQVITGFSTLKKKQLKP